MMCGTVENQFREWRATVAVCQNSRKRWLLDIGVQLFGMVPGSRFTVEGRTDSRSLIVNLEP
jgi:hypothetical protein